MQLHMSDCMVVPILLYGAEIYGYEISAAYCLAIVHPASVPVRVMWQLNRDTSA